MKKVIIFGAGNYFKHKKEFFYKNDISIVEIWDNDTQKWGKEIDGIRICKPYNAQNVLIIVCVVRSQDIVAQLIKELKIPVENIMLFDQVERKVLLDYIADSVDIEKREIGEYLQDNELSMFNYAWTKNMPEYVLEFDDSKGLFYWSLNNVKTYLKRSLDTEKKARVYIESLLIEQNVKSPHYYGEANDNIGKVLFDIGAAEGNYSVESLNYANHIYIVECDGEWIEALTETFRDYSEKVTIINKFIDDSDTENTITLISLLKMAGNNSIKVKMDIEGMEERVLHAAKKDLQCLANIEFCVCTYHHSTAFEEIKEIFVSSGYNVSNTQGYMFFSTEWDQFIVSEGYDNKTDLRRALIFAKN